MHGEIFKLKIHQNIFINNYTTITFRNISSKIMVPYLCKVLLGPHFSDSENSYFYCNAASRLKNNLCAQLA